MYCNYFINYNKMEVLDKILVTLNPLRGYKPLNYSIFLGNGELPFDKNDADTLWDASKNKLKEHWKLELPKFNSLIVKFKELTAMKVKPVICYIYPSGDELLWTPEKSTAIKAYRGEALKKLISATKQDGVFSLAAIIQYSYIPIYKFEEFTDPIPTFVNNLKVDKELGIKPIAMDNQVPPSILRSFWSYYHSKSSHLLNKYGNNQPISPDMSKYINVYSHGEFEKIFSYFEKLDYTIPDSKGMMISIISDDGNQYTIFRQNKNIWFGVLPGTEGTRELIAKAPVNIRILMVSVYKEE